MGRMFRLTWQQTQQSQAHWLRPTSSDTLTHRLVWNWPGWLGDSNKKHGHSSQTEWEKVIKRVLVYWMWRRMKWTAGFCFFVIYVGWFLATKAEGAPACKDRYRWHRLLGSWVAVRGRHVLPSRLYCRSSTIPEDIWTTEEIRWRDQHVFAGQHREGTGVICVFTMALGS